MSNTSLNNSKIPDNDIKTDSANFLNEVSFGIGDIGLIFDILRNKMYKNPILAIAREVSCNARDAHREIGKSNVPIHITFPNAFSPEYRIQDFGPGITPDRMADVFVKYAASTKRNDALQQGLFGCGSKTPFSYTDTFSIITITSSIKRIYTAYIDESNIGKMALQSEQPTDECNGTTIVVPVSRNDFREFIDCTIAATEYWDVKPILWGVTPLPQYKNVEIIHSGTQWSLYKQTKYSYGNAATALAIVDGIPYSIESSNFTDKSGKYINFLNNPFLLHFNIGEISLAASRDTIYYDDKTQKNILARLKVISEEMSETLKKKIETATIYRLALAIRDSISSELSMFRSEIDKITWNGNKLKSRINSTEIGIYSKIITYQKSTRYRDSGKILKNLYQEIEINDSTKVFHNDKTQENIGKYLVEELFELYPNYKTIQIVSTPTKPTCHVYKQEVENVPGVKPSVTYDLKPLELIEVQKLSTVNFTKAPRIKNDKLAKKVDKVLAYKLYQHNNMLKHNLTSIDDVGGVYLIVDYLHNHHSSGDININTYDQLNEFNIVLGKDIVGFTQTRAKKLSKDWITLKEAIEDKYKENITSDSMLLELKNNALAANWFAKYKFYTLLTNRQFNLNKINNQNNIFIKYINEK